MEVISYLLGKKAGGGSSPVLQEKNITITENGTETITADTGYDGLSSVNIDTNVPSSGGVIKEKDVNFYDYDGTLTNSYTKNEFLALSQMPENPTHQGLTSQGWNWSLTDAKDYVNDYGMLNIGQMYNTDDGSVRVHIKLQDGRLSPYLGFAVDGTAIINWGDGSSTDTVTGTSTSTYIFTLHNYQQAGEYVISITSESDIYIGGSSTGTYLLTANGSTENDNISNVYRSSIIRIDGINGIINSYAFGYCRSLKNITISNTVISIQDHAFMYCVSLSNIVVPDNVINFGSHVFMYCYSLSNVIIPNDIVDINPYMFYQCYSLSDIIIPDSVVNIGSHAFSNCHSLSNIIIPNNLVSIGDNAFENCYSLLNIMILNGLTSIGTYIFSNCSSLSNVTLPNNMASIPNSFFSGCASLLSIMIPNTVTNFGSNSFSSCYSLSNIKIPSTVTKINASSFSNCHSIKYYDFSDHTSMPTLLNKNAFSNIASDCKIIVPDDLYESWIAATNWSTYASNIIKESEWNA